MMLYSQLQLLVASIQMDADANHGSKERIVFFPMNHEPV